MGNSLGLWKSPDDSIYDESEIDTEAQTKSVPESVPRRPGSPVLIIPHEDQGTLSPKKKPQKKGRQKNSRRQHRKNYWWDLEDDQS
jgi:hypothetical protein